jgi:hypothetical protein
VSSGRSWSDDRFIGVAHGVHAGSCENLGGTVWIDDVAITRLKTKNLNDDW